MAEPSSLELLERWRSQADQDAAALLFYRYVDRLIALARVRMSSALAQRLDAEDIVQSALRSFFARVRDGRLLVQPGGELWELLSTLTMRKLYGNLEHHLARRRSLQREQGQDGSAYWLEIEAVAHDPGPEDNVVLDDELECLLKTFSPSHRRIVELRLQDFTTPEIAEQVKLSQRMVRLVLSQFGKKLKKRLASLDEPETA